MAIALNDNIKVNAPKPSEERYLNNIFVYTSTTEVDIATVGRRYTGLTVNILGNEYWYKNTIADGGLIPKILGVTNGISGTGTTNTLPKFNSISGLSNSNFTDNGSTGQYASGSFVVQLNPGGNQIFRVSRNQANTYFDIGNPDISQTFDIISSNYVGASYKSGGFLTLNAGSAYTEGLRVLSGGLLRFTQTPPSGSSTDFVLGRDLSGNVTQVPQSGFTDGNAVHKTGNESISGIKTFTNFSVFRTEMVNDGSTHYRSYNSSGNINYQVVFPGPSQGAFRAGTVSAYLEGRESGPQYLSVSVPLQSPEPTASNHLTTKNYVDNKFGTTITGTTNFVPKFGTPNTLTNSNITDIGTAVTINTLTNITYSDNNFNGVNIKNTNTGTTALSGFNIKDLSNNNICGVNFVPSNYSNPTLQNTLLIYTVGNQKLGFTTNTSTVTPRGDMYFSVNPTAVVSSTNPNQIQILGASRNIIINYGGVDTGHNFQVNGTTFISGTTRILGSITATSFVKSGGTSSQFLMADGSVSTGSTSTGTSAVSYWTAGTGVNAIAVSGGNNTSSGDTSLAEGYGNIAGGDFSHVEGFQNIVYGRSSHAEGEGTIANGDYGSHAEGNITEANGIASHAEGQLTFAQSNFSHAEGNQTTANGLASHAEGYVNTTNGDYNHVEGAHNITNGDASHAEGWVTQAINHYAHAEGQSTIAQGISSHAEGYTTQANGNYSHSEGQNTIANGDMSHAEGNGTVTNNAYAHSEGIITQANGLASHAEGNNTIANGLTSHSEGTNTLADGNYSHAGGYGSQALGTTSFVFGDNSIANNTNVNVLGANITGSTADTTYVDQFNIKTLVVNTSITNLGIDSTGNIVTGRDTYVTGGTFSNGVTTFRNNSGGTFQVTGLTNGISGTGTPNVIAKWSSASGLTNSNLTDNGTVISASTDVIINGNLGIGTASTTDKTTIIDSTLAASGSLSGSVLNVRQTWNTSGSPTAIKVNIINTTAGTNANVFDFQIGGSSQLQLNKFGTLSVGLGTSAAPISNAKLDVYSTISGSTPFNVEGTQGQLFSVTDTMIGWIHGVNDISGVPLFRVNSNEYSEIKGELYFQDSNVTGGYLSGITANTIVKTISLIENGGNMFFYDYYARNILTNGMRGGTIMALTDNTGITSTDTYVGDLNATTSGLTLSTIISGTNIILSAIVTTGSWIIKANTRII